MDAGGGGDSNVILQNAHYDATGAGTSDSRSDGYNGQVEAALGESSSGGGGIAGIGGGGLSCTNDVLWLNDSPVADLGLVNSNYNIHLYNIHIR